MTLETIAGLLPQVVISGLTMGLVYSLIAVGLSFIFGLMDIVNFAHGEYMMMAMYGAFWLWALWGLDPLVSLPIVAVLLFLAGLLTYWGIIKRVINAPPLAQIVVTFGILIILRSLAQMLWSADYRTVDNPLLSGTMRMAGVSVSVSKLAAALGAAAAVLLLFMLLKRTRMGIALQATAENRTAAQLMGINTDWTMSLGWGLGLSCVAVAGVLLVNFNYVFPQIGALFGVLSFVIVALGGFGSLVGAFVAGILVGLIEALGGFLVAPAYKYAIVFAMYLVVVLVRPRGLFGKF